MTDTERQAESLEDIARCLREGRDPLREFQVAVIGGWDYAPNLADLFEACINDPDGVRRKPRTITIQAEIPEPVRDAPPEGTEYFYPSPGYVGEYSNDRWQGYKSEYDLLRRGYVHLTKEAAIAHEKAMRPFGGEEWTVSGAHAWIGGKMTDEIGQCLKCGTLIFPITVSRCPFCSDGERND